MNFLPTTLEEAACRGWRELDIIFVSGDAYIDHPAFGVPLLARLMEARGFRVGIIAQPDWRSPDAFTALGRPRLFFAVSAGAMDSMVAHYTPARKLRHDDAYTPGNRHGARPNRATLVYTARLKELFRGVPVVIGGIEASLRRFAHYDFWENKIRRSILFDAKADLLIYGMGERPLLEVAERLRDGEAVRDLKDIRGTACAEPASAGSSIAAARVMLPSWEEVAAEPAKFNQAFVQVSREQNPWSGKVVLQPHGDRHLVVNAPSLPLSQEELDELYSLPFVREPHPSYREQIPAFEQIKTSITTHRGCYGGCAFCAITHHQGKAIQSRSASSVVGEIKVLTGKRWFRGTVSDVGGPTANMYGTSCADPVAQGACRRGSCLYPSPCKHLRQSGARGAELLRQVRRVNGVKLVTVCSGIRYDLLAQQPEYFRELLAHHVGGLLKVAPEHLSTSVVNLMRKPGPREFELFLARFREESELLGRVQYVVPYLMSGHPGCTLADMADLALLLKKHRLRVEQVQDFTPTPGTLATCMYYTGSDPFTGQAVYVARGDKEKSLQKALLLAHLPDQRQHVLQALKACGRMAVAQELLPPVGSRNVGRAEKGVRGMGGKEVVPTTKVPGPRIKKR